MEKKAKKSGKKPKEEIKPKVEKLGDSLDELVTVFKQANKIWNDFSNKNIQSGHDREFILAKTQIDKDIKSVESLLKFIESMDKK